jgi:pyridoxamine 5'-phosphate oxidase family protein
MAFTDAELSYLSSQRLGRLATVAPDGTPQNSPVGFRYNPQTQTIDIRGHNLAASRKFRNVAANGRVAFVVDDIASYDPWRAHGIEIRGHAEAVTGEPAGGERYFSPEVIRIHPERIFTWGVDPESSGMQRRDVTEGASH